MESKQNILSDIAENYFNQFLYSVSCMKVIGNQAYTENAELVAEKIAGRLMLLLPECTITISSIEFKQSEQGGELHYDDNINIFMQCIDAEFEHGNVIQL